jgi:hypothetical protein
MKKEERYFSSQRDTPDGRNFVYWNRDPSKQEKENYRDNYDKLFPDAPGAGI